MQQKLSAIFILISITAGFISCNSKPDNSTQDPTTGLNLQDLNGTWQFVKYKQLEMEADSLYPANKPIITFDLENGRISGNTSCNSFSGELQANDEKLEISDQLVMTKIGCEGKGESLFIEALNSVDGFFWLDPKSIWLLSGTRQVMVMRRQ